MAFYNVILSILTNIGFFNIILPFLLIYSIIYGLLAKYQLIGNPYKEDAEGKATRSLISMISAAVGFLVVGATNVVLSIFNLIPYIVLFLLTVFFLLIAIAPFVTNEKGMNLQGRTGKILLGVSIVIFFIVVAFSLGLFSYIASLSHHISVSSSSLQYIEQIVYTVLILGVLFGVVYWATKPPSKQSTGQQSQSNQK
ncbi:hypothetical protein YN1_2640 [Nanoarchaeota archaeon]